MPLREHPYPKPFFLVAADRDSGLFDAIGPVEGDSPWVRMVARPQGGGRKV